jgi:hypothetical protein
MGSNFTRATRALEKAEMIIRQGVNEEDFQSVGLNCREAITSLAQSVFNPSEHLIEGEPAPSETDAKRMLEAFIQSTLSGKRNEVARRFAKSSLALANQLVHKRTASHDDAALCIDATSTLVAIVGRLAGKEIDSSHLFPIVRISYKELKITSDLHTYQLQIAIDNSRGPAIGGLKLEIDFPDLDNIPYRWISLIPRKADGYSLIELGPTSDFVSIMRENRVVSITYRPGHQILPGEIIELDSDLELIYKFDSGVYSNLNEVPPVMWRLYADVISPRHGEVSMTELNCY